MELKKVKLVKILFTSLADLSLQKGYDSVRVEDIAINAGIHRATFYRHLESKQDLMERGTHIFWDEILIDMERFRIDEKKQKSFSETEVADMPGYLSYFFHSIKTYKSIFLAFLNEDGSLYFRLESRKRIEEFIKESRLVNIRDTEQRKNASLFTASCLMTTLELFVFHNNDSVIQDYFIFVSHGIFGFSERKKHSRFR